VVASDCDAGIGLLAATTGMRRSELSASIASGLDCDLCMATGCRGRGGRLGIITLGNQVIQVGSPLAGQRARIRLDGQVMHVITVRTATGRAVCLAFC
jgi:hypothetical protein